MLEEEELNQRETQSKKGKQMIEIGDEEVETKTRVY